MSRHPLLLLLTFAICALISCDRGSTGSPSAPTPQAPLPSGTSGTFGTGPTRVIRIDGNISFGDVDIGGRSFKEFPICNDGNTALAVQDITAPDGYTFGTPSYDWESIAPGQCMSAWGVFEPLFLGPHVGTVTIYANQTSGSSTFEVTGTGFKPPVPRTAFGEGRYLVGIGVAPGRYFSNPGRECYWHRTTNPPPVPGRDITWMNSGSSDPDQWMVDILSSDTAFETSNGCGEWSRNPARVLDANVITPGIWLVRDQVPQGRYRADARPGCSWVRLRNFEGTMNAVSVIESGSTQQSTQITVSIRSTDVGFQASDACGTWTRVS